MGKPVYSMITSVDGYVSDPDGDFGWRVPEEESHEFINERARSAGTYLYGRRMYETMVFWETARFDPEAVRTLKADAELDLAVDGRQSVLRRPDSLISAIPSERGVPMPEAAGDRGFGPSQVS
jgi:dihydrofolate reductase